jgi:probable F420-dependent oxidoreductase
MRFAVEVTNFGDYAEPDRLCDLARSAEAAGWEGLFLWDHVAGPWGEGGAPPTADPWVLLAAAACATGGLRLGTNVTPVARRRPHELAAQVATLDRLSEGRAVLGVGLGGVPAEFEAYGDPSDPGVRAERLDEGLDVVTALWSGDEVHHHGRHFQAEGVRHRLRPVQQPRVPIWVGGSSRAALRRAARWDGWTAGLIVDESGQVARPPEQVARDVATVRGERAEGAGDFDVAVSGYSDPADVELTGEFADAGVTWWLESLNGFRGSFDEMRARVEAGPPGA